jgi:hypothetical protein
MRTSSNSIIVLVVLFLGLIAVVLRSVHSPEFEIEEIESLYSEICWEYEQLTTAHASEDEWREFEKQVSEATAPIIADLYEHKPLRRMGSKQLYQLAKYDLPKAIRFRGRNVRRNPMNTFAEIEKHLATHREEKAKEILAKRSEESPRIAAMLIIDSLLLIGVSYTFYAAIRTK